MVQQLSTSDLRSRGGRRLRAQQILQLVINNEQKKTDKNIQGLEGYFAAAVTWVRGVGVWSLYASRTHL